MEQDVIGFKQGLARLMHKHHLASLKGGRGSFIGYWGGKNSAFVAYCGIFTSLPPAPFDEIVEQPSYNGHKIKDELQSLFDYYNVRHLTNQYLENFNIGFDDNNQFLMLNVNLEFFETEGKVDHSDFDHV